MTNSFMKDRDNLKDLKRIVKIDWPTLAELQDDLFGEVKHGRRNSRK